MRIRNLTASSPSYVNHPNSVFLNLLQGYKDDLELQPLTMFENPKTARAVDEVKYSKNFDRTLTDIYTSAKL